MLGHILGVSIFQIFDFKTFREFPPFKRTNKNTKCTLFQVTYKPVFKKTKEISIKIKSTENKGKNSPCDLN